MKIYIDESGNVNNHSRLLANSHFVVAMVRVLDEKGLKRSYERFVSSNKEELKKLDKPKMDRKKQVVVEQRGAMFNCDEFVELKGNEFDLPMKNKFIDFFSQKNNFEVYYIVLDNKKLSNTFCNNKARAFNYSLKLALTHFIKQRLLPSEECELIIDERNVSPKSIDDLETYLNKRIKLKNGRFSVSYHDSKNVEFIQIADVFANILYSNMITDNYHKRLEVLKSTGQIKAYFIFPLR